MSEPLHLTGVVTRGDGTRGVLEGTLTWTPGATTPPPGDLADLTAADIEYLGALRMPQEIAGMLTFAYGGIGGRKVDGKVRLFITGDEVNYHAPLAELEDPGVYDKHWETAPQMRFVQWWWDPYQGRRGTYLTVAGARSMRDDLLTAAVRDPGRSAQLRQWADRLLAWVRGRTKSETEYEYFEFPVGQSVIGAIYHDPATSRVFWTYYDTYNVSGRPDWALGATTLHADGTMSADGPWRFACPTGDGWTAYGAWRGLGLVIRPDTGELVTGSSLMSGNASSPWGCNAYGGGRLPVQGHPWNVDLLQPTRYLDHYPMLGKIDGEGRLAPGEPLRSQRRRLDMPIWEPGNVAPLNVNNTLYGYDTWREVDSCGLGYWFDNINGKQGALFLGACCGSPVQDPTKLEAGHEWYATASNNYHCAHGHPAPVQITGPVSTANFSAMWIYKIPELLAVSRGERPDYSPDPLEINLQTRYGVHAAAAYMMNGNKQIGGTYFDRDTRQLYLQAPRCDNLTAWGAWSALIHVFRIGGA